jgi:hypothetical protein
MPYVPSSDNPVRVSGSCTCDFGDSTASGCRYSGSGIGMLFVLLVDSSRKTSEEGAGVHRREGYRGLQGFHTLEDEFPQVVPRPEYSTVLTPEAPKPAPPGPYGSVVAGQAAAKLERLGCTVYPPKPKDAMQWDMLAGE